MNKLITIFILALTISHDSIGDEFPWVQQILFQDSITWVRTNEGLYKIIQKKNKTIQWSKELDSASIIYIDSQNTIWVVDFGTGLFLNKGDKWHLIKNDTVKYISNIYEFNSEIFILTSLNNEMRYLSWNSNKWKEITTFKPPHGKGGERAYGLAVNNKGIYTANSFYDELKKGFVNNFYWFDFKKWHVIKQDATDFYFDKGKATWIFFFGSFSDRIEVNNSMIKVPDGEIISNYDVDKNGTPWILTKNGFVFSYSNNRWTKHNNAINPLHNSRLRFWVKNEKEFWVGEYSYVAYFLNNKWTELAFLSPQPQSEGPEQESETTHSKMSNENHKWGFINDSDGYSNLRKSPDGTSEIIAKVLTNFKFKYFENSRNDWWKVETERGTIGYIHRSRIKAI